MNKNKMFSLLEILNDSNTFENTQKIYEIIYENDNNNM